MSKRDYILIATAMRAATITAGAASVQSRLGIRRAVQELAERLQEDNAAFKWNAFVEAAGHPILMRRY